MRIVHRVDGGRSIERLVSLDGSGLEIVRTAEEVHFYMPDRRVVLVESRTDDGSLLRALPVPGPRLDELYTLEVRKGSKLLGRDVKVLDILPRDAYRYGYRLWLDEQTAMPLRSEVVNGEGKAVEAMHFTRLEVRDRIDPRELEPAVDATGYQWVRTGKRGEQRVANTSWRPRKLPPGFRLVATRVQIVPGVPVPVQHLIFSDGFASVSVFSSSPGRPADRRRRRHLVRHRGERGGDVPHRGGRHLADRGDHVAPHLRGEGAGRADRRSAASSSAASPPAAPSAASTCRPRTGTLRLRLIDRPQPRSLQSRTR